MQARLLMPGDVAAAESLLLAHADSSLALLASLRRAGLASARWAGAFADGALVGLAALSENGQLLVQAPIGAEVAACAAVEGAGRPVRSIQGPWAQAATARAALGLSAAKTRVDERELLLALDLESLRVPPALLEGSVVARAPRADEVEQVVRLRLDYLREMDLESIDAAAGERVRATFAAARAAATLFVVESKGELVAMTTFNARLPDRVGVAAVYTPPGMRGRGFGRCAVAGHLLAARAGGVGRASLFTRAGNEGARRAYASLGFVEVGDYAVIVFE